MKPMAIGLSTLVMILVLRCALIWAQATAEISGTVRDQSGAVLPGVEITATQTQTGVVRRTVTNETGFYALPNLLIGPYRIEATLVMKGGGITPASEGLPQTPVCYIVSR